MTVMETQLLMFEEYREFIECERIRRKNMVWRDADVFDDSCVWQELLCVGQEWDEKRFLCVWGLMFFHDNHGEYV